MVSGVEVTEIPYNWLGGAGEGKSEAEELATRGPPRVGRLGICHLSQSEGRFGKVVVAAAKLQAPTSAFPGWGFFLCYSIV
jgi:hypothetical protein